MANRGTTSPHAQKNVRASGNQRSAICYLPRGPPIENRSITGPSPEFDHLRHERVVGGGREPGRNGQTCGTTSWLKIGTTRLRADQETDERGTAPSARTVVVGPVVPPSGSAVTSSSVMSRSSLKKSMASG